MIFLKNYTSDVPVSTTIGRIEKVLIQCGVSSIEKEYGPQAEIAAIRFRIKLIDREVAIRLPCDRGKALEALWLNYVDGDKLNAKGDRIEDCGSRKRRTKADFAEQAERTAWRIMQDWIEVQMSRHLWPSFYKLIANRKPATIFGEQSAGKDAEEWICGVRADLEGIGHAFGCSELCAASIKAPHNRPRFYWVSSDPNNRPGFQQMGGGWNQKKTVPALHAQSGVFWELESKPEPLANGVSGRVAMLRGYGNAIVPEVAAQFILAAQEAIADLA